MKRFLTTTTVLSLALAPVQPWPLLAQTLADDGSVVGPDGTVLCVPTEAAPCDLQAIAEALAAQTAAPAEGNAADAQADAQAAAQAEAEAKAAADAAAQAEAQAAADAAAQAEAQAAADAAAQAEAQAAAAAQAEAQAAADAAAQAEAQAAAEAQAQAEAEAQAAADAAAQAQAEAEAQAAADAQAQAEAEAQAAADAAAQAEAQAAADAAAQAEAQAAAEADAQAAADAAAQAEAQAAADAQAQAEAEAQAAADAAAQAQAQAEAEAQAAADAAAQAEAQAAADAEAQGEADAQVQAQAEAEAAEAEAAAVAEPVDAPVPEAAAVEALGALLTSQSPDQAAAPDLQQPAAEAAAVPLAPPDLAGQGTQDAGAGAPAPEQVVTEVITEATTRSSDEEFAAAPVAVAGGKKKDRLSDLEKVGLVALGALVAGAVLSNGNEVVSNTGDRVVVRDPDGRFTIFKDDDTLLRRPGATVQTETYRDGSTRTIVNRADGGQVVTIRDASGRVLRRAAYDADGREMILIDDMAPEERIDVSTLPTPPREALTISSRDEDAALKAALAAEQARRIGRSFSLRQIREITEVRALAPTVDVDSITFDTGSAAIRAVEAGRLADLGALIGDLLADNPDEVFLIEGHTDAVGSAASNLALSDRRAESVALALTEYFAIPPENLIVQGYGESELLIRTDADERLNRRVAVRVVTPLLRRSAMR